MKLNLSRRKREDKEKKKVLILSATILIISLITLFYHYSYPRGLFWDENYHIASAEKYVKGTFFLEPHPPLGKLFIALGEVMIHKNTNLNLTYFTKTDFIKNVPKDYSFAGVRFFPTLFGALCPLLIFFIILLITKKKFTAFMFSLIFLFNNAFVLESRGAMLDSAEIFFILTSILLFTYMIEKRKFGSKFYFTLGVLIALSTMVKLNGAIVFLLPVFLILFEIITSRKIRLNSIIIKSTYLLVGFLIITSSIFYIHFNLANNIVNGRTYEVQNSTLKIITSGKERNPLYLPALIKAYIKYEFKYEKGVPAFKPCSSDETGSLPATWPFGGRSINYKWDIKEKTVQYLRMQPSVVVWLIVLISIIISTSLIITKALFDVRIKDERLFFYMITFTSMYLSYMIVMMSITRVLYLGHYLIPIIFGIINASICFSYLSKARNIKTLNLVLLAITLLALVNFILTMPVVYYIPISKAHFEFIKRLTLFNF